MDDECLTSEVLHHIAFEVISQLDKVEEYRWLLPKELSLRNFLVEKIRSLQLVIEEQGVAPSLIQASTALAQNPFAFAGCCCFGWLLLRHRDPNLAGSTGARWWAGGRSEHLL
jgi:hypothetical protein